MPGALLSLKLGKEDVSIKRAWVRCPRETSQLEGQQGHDDTDDHQPVAEREPPVRGRHLHTLRRKAEEGRATGQETPPAP